MKQSQNDRYQTRRMKEGAELRVYDCDFCGTKFERTIEKLGEGHNAGSTMVRCPACKNFLKTWQE